MKHFISIKDLADPKKAVQTALALKKQGSNLDRSMTADKVLCLLFFNNSLRTRLSTERAAMYLGMKVMVMQISDTGWALEFEDGVIMNADKAEHVKEAAAVVSQYADVIGIRAFPTLTDKEADLEERVLRAFSRYATVPVLSLEGATEHPLQALADAMTIEEHRTVSRPKVVLSWAPHVRTLPHAVANSFVLMMQRQEVDLVLTYPKEYALDPEVVGNSKVTHQQEEAFEGADFVYVKNWSSFEPYGQTPKVSDDFTITAAKLQAAKFMHCLPIRRNVVAEDAVLDGPNSLVIQQANNRTYSALWAIRELLTAAK
ncbi:MAG: N-acetylornithine carbamoyltransferase [Flavobacteriaceae bacterium]|jgi:N-succinyl-L-ornithine transcarbamylase